MNITTMRTLNKSEAEQISKNWWVLLLLGIISFVAGIVVLSINWTLFNLSLFIGALFMLRGFFQLVSPPSMGVSRTANVVVGIVGILVGLAVILYPAISLFILAIFIGAFLIFWGAANIVNSIVNRHLLSYWWVSLIAGIIAVPLGILALAQPVLSLDILILAIGIWAIAAGIFETALAFEVKNLPKMTTEVETEAEIRRIA